MMTELGPDFKRLEKEHPWLCWWVNFKFQVHLFLVRFGINIWNDCGELVPWGDEEES